VSTEIRDKKILIVDDEPHILKILEFLLKDEGYTVLGVSTGEEAIKAVDRESFDLVILDISLPGIDGFTVCRYLREKGLGVLMLSSRDEDESVIRGLETGALDYVRKPFNHRELILRISNLISTPAIPSRTSRYECCGLTVNLDREEVMLKGKKIHLSPTEYLLLVLLMRRQGSVVSFEEILREVWGAEEWEGGRQLIKVNIQRLRSRIERDPGHPEMILNQWGRGYCFDPPVTIS